MRILLGILLLIFLAAIGLFAVQNTQSITVRFWNWSVTGPVALLAIGAYLLGMISGWNVIAFLRTSLRGVRSQTPRD